MASSLSVSDEGMICSICYLVFNDPVVLKCSHSFCEECLRRYWSVQEVLLCPDCRKECSQDEPTRSLAFSSLCEKFKSRTCLSPAGDMCPEHEEKLKLFCFDDKQPICVVCYTSKKHKNHQCAPLVEAVEDLKAEVKSEVSGMLQNLQILNKSKADYEDLAEILKEERQSAENMIRQEFDSLHQYLKEEEEARIAALREEEVQKYEKTKNRIEKLSNDISNLSMTLKMINKEMEMDELTFLKNYTNGHYSPAKNSLPEPGVISGIDTAKHLAFLNINLRAKMCELLHDPPKAVSLDPNTASNKLVVSEDRSSVYFVEQKLEVANNPERFVLGVLGSQGISSGLHCWDVEVGDNDHWTLGVVKQSVERKKILKMDPSSGMWSIRLINGKYRAGKSRKDLTVTEKPRVIRVQLDYDNGVITFSDPSKGPVLFTFTDTFVEALFPYLNTASAICPLHIS